MTNPPTPGSKSWLFHWGRKNEIKKFGGVSCKWGEKNIVVGVFRSTLSYTFLSSYRIQVNAMLPDSG